MAIVTQECLHPGAINAVLRASIRYDAYFLAADLLNAGVLLKSGDISFLAFGL
jgi:hypothetical protein